MKIRLHFRVKGVSDSIVIEGDTIEDCRAKAHEEIKKRGATDAYSEKIK